MQEEIWKDIPNYEGVYQISSLGYVKSMERIVNSGRGYRRINQKILSFWVCSSGYRTVKLYGVKNKKSTLYRVHKLMAIVFLNHNPSKYKVVVDHIDNNKLNNRLDNLQLISARENVSKDKKTEYRNIRFEGGAYVVKIYINKKYIYLGRYKDISEAISIRDKAFLDFKIK